MLMPSVSGIWRQEHGGKRGAGENEHGSYRRSTAHLLVLRWRAPMAGGASAGAALATSERNMEEQSVRSRERYAFWPIFRNTHHGFFYVSSALRGMPTLYNIRLHHAT